MAKAPVGYQSRSVKSTNELRNRLFFVVFALLIFRIGIFVPVPGINMAVLNSLLEHQSGTILDMLNMFSGGALKQASVFSLGVMPYISASIIIQLLVAVHPPMKELKKEGQAGRQKINKYTRYLTVFICVIQALGISTGLPKIAPGVVVIPSLNFYVISVISLVAGTMFLVWLGEQISDRGIGNGMSLIIFAGIVANLPIATIHTLTQAREGNLHYLSLLAIFVIVIIVVYFVVYIERGQRRIVISYAKRQEGRQMLAAQNSHLPFKVNMAGVIPAIFASTILMVPASLGTWFGQSSGWGWLLSLSDMLGRGKPLHFILFAAAIIFFSFFYTAMQYNPRDTAENLKKSGAFIPGIRPGEQTSKYVDKIMTKLTLIGGIYVAFVCLLPEFMQSTWNVQFYFGGTSLLIVVVVVMDFISQIQTQLMSSKYESVLKKANFQNYRR